jgi:hypothetical protein
MIPIGAVLDYEDPTLTNSGNASNRFKDLANCSDFDGRNYTKFSKQASCPLGRMRGGGQDILIWSQHSVRTSEFLDKMDVSVQII